MVTYQALHMPEPCTKVHYDDLPYDPNKRPCHLCKKPVYDFRDKDAAFLNKVWKKHGGDFCGAFRYDQFSEKSTEYIPSILQRAKLYWAGVYLSFLSLLASPSKGQETALYHTTEQHIPDSTASPSIHLTTKKGHKCVSSVSVELYINGVKYNSYNIQYDTIEVKLPSSIRATDEIRIEKTIRKRYRHWTTTVVKSKAVNFHFGDRELIEIQVTRKKRLNLFYRRTFIGCPKFR